VVGLHRAVRGRVETITAKREGKRWYVALSCDDVPGDPLEPTNSMVGVDLGLMSFLTTSEAESIPNHRYPKAANTQLTAAQAARNRKQRGSHRRKKAAQRVAKIHEKIRHQGLDHAHKTALVLVRDHDVIVQEKLVITNMIRRPRPRPDGHGGYEANGAAAKTGLNKSINDAGRGIFLRILAAKAESAGRQVIAVDPRHTCQRCTRCGHVAAENRVSQAEFRCRACDYRAQADSNAARHILRAGLALQEA
jgi:putative transposase